MTCELVTPTMKIIALQRLKEALIIHFIWKVKLERTAAKDTAFLLIPIYLVLEIFLLLTQFSLVSNEPQFSWKSYKKISFKSQYFQLHQACEPNMRSLKWKVESDFTGTKATLVFNALKWCNENKQ